MDVYQKVDKLSSSRLPEDRVIDLVTVTIEGSIRALKRLDSAWMTARYKYRYVRLFGVADYTRERGKGND